MRRKEKSRTRAFISCDVEAGRCLQLAVPTLPFWPPAHLTSSCYCPASAQQRQQKSCRCPHHISSSTPFYPTQVPCDHGFRSMPANFYSDTTMSRHKILPGDQICNHCKWHLMVTRCATNSSFIIPFLCSVQENQSRVKEATAWIPFASSNVFSQLTTPVHWPPKIGFHRERKSALKWGGELCAADNQLGNAFFIIPNPGPFKGSDHLPLFFCCKRVNIACKHTAPTFSPSIYLPKSAIWDSIRRSG